jgi:hypothetical protein
MRRGRRRQMMMIPNQNSGRTRAELGVQTAVVIKISDCEKRNLVPELVDSFNSNEKVLSVRFACM